MIVREPGSGTREVSEAALGRKGLKLSAVAMTLGSTEAIKRAVAAGLRLDIVSRLTVAMEVAMGRLALLPVRDLELRRPLHRLTVRNRHPGAATRAFIALLEESRDMVDTHHR